MPRCWNCRRDKPLHDGEYIDNDFECTDCSIDLEGKYGYSTDVGKKNRSAKERSDEQSFAEKSEASRKKERGKGNFEAKKR